ncbi:macro domain-containing protein [Kosmotoga pacifica]|uniref:Appr-1-p processing protein n=1 Tax=Kosmotoga pacifica TaxID=1330330 RepID=A0A0G2ZD73_9BACT|nr:macro domain-containing protein [Kosmotoga pacifica]AKI96763.1 Appr-1-p processing protein [Kosmotoga pacifica]
MKSIVLEDGKVIQIVQGDITREEVDAIVNAANGYLRHGGGVAGAIVRAGGKIIQEESDRIIRKTGPLEVSEVAVTGAGELHAKFIIHVHGPQYGQEDVQRKLYNSFMNVLKKAGELGVKTISIPAVSSGIFGVPKEIAARAFFQAVKDYFRDNPGTSIVLIRACNIDKPTTEVFEKISSEYFEK